MAIVMLTNLKESLIVASNRFLQKCPVTHILVRIARRVRTLSALTRRFKTRVVRSVYEIPHECTYMKTYFSQCAARLLAWLLFFPMFLESFIFRQPASDSVLLTDSPRALHTACICISVRVLLLCDTAHHFNESYPFICFFRPESHAWREEKVRTHIYAKLK